MPLRYSERRAAMDVDDAATLVARPFHLELGFENSNVIGSTLG
jgi:hypothetical protein